LQQVDLGIEPDRVLTMQLGLRGQRYQQPQQIAEFCSRLLEQVQALPGVRAAAVSDSLPPDTTSGSSDFRIEGRSLGADQPPIAYFIRVSTDYSRVLGTRLLAGRDFTAGDTANAIQVVLINETLQREVFPAEDPIGKRLNLGTEREPDWHQVIGIIGDVKYNGLAERVQPAIYLAAAQAPTPSLSLIVKTEAADPLTLTEAVRGEVSRLDPELPIAQIRTMEERLAGALAQPRFRTLLIALFAAVALILACIGIYGVMSYSVSQRTHEIGIRMALGAKGGDVLRMVIRQGLTVAATGIVIGLGGSLALTRLMNSLLFGIGATDPLTFAATALVLAVTALAACYLPARRATKVDPMIALRYE
jgi:putative ABC transport system permease protein